MRASLPAMVAAAVLIAGCTFGDSQPSADTSATFAGETTNSGTATETTTAPSDKMPIVGRWQQVHSCQQLVAALRSNHLQELAPGVVGDYFPGKSPQQLARKPDLCSGAVPQSHSHFFNAAGQFGSLDQDGNQVDDGAYAVVSNHVLRIGDAEFDYRVIGGETLALHPVITAKDRRAALADPLKFSMAGWQVAVSYDGLAWKGASCDGWC